MRASQNEVYSTDKPQKWPRTCQKDITFTEENSQGVQRPHDDTLVVTLITTNYRTRRILIDNGSSANILYLFAFEQMGIKKDKLLSTASPLVGFTGDKLYSANVITLSVIARVSPHQVTKAIDFLVVDYPSAYNDIIDRPTLNKMKAITFFHLSLANAFPDQGGCRRS